MVYISMLKKWFIIEGNIGSGKSTILEKLKNDYVNEVIPEPVDLWTNIKDKNNKNMLEHFYEDMNRHSYMFQTIATISRLNAIEKTQYKAVRYSERSIWTDKYIFGRMCVEDNKMNDIEKVAYEYWLKWLETKFNKKPDGIIYVRCSPEKCLERIANRGRVEETGITIDYLKRLHDYHEEWLNNWKKTPVLVIDNEIDNDWKFVNEINNFALSSEYDDIENDECSIM